MSLARLARLREATYRILSQSFLFPGEEHLRGLAAAARDLRASGGPLIRFAFFEQWSRLLGLLEECDRAGGQRFQEQYISLFAASSEGVPCPPYESAYRDPARRAAGWLLAEVEREYAAAGLALAPGSGELPDLVSVEMEFVAVLCGREAQAWEREDRRQAVDLLGRQQSFLDSHLARWLPDFGERVRAADSDGMYAALCEGAQVFIGYDVDLLGVLLETFGGPAELDSEGERRRARGEAR